MTNYDHMPAGCEMDHEIEDMVMGIGPRFRPRLGGLRYDAKHYSTNIAAAWEVVEKMMPTHKLFLFYLNHDLWEASFQRWERTEEVGKGYTDIGNTAPLSICRAALKAEYANK